MDQTIIDQSLLQHDYRAAQKRKAFVIISIIAVLLVGGFSVYWFYFRSFPLTEQDKLSILDKLNQSSASNFTPEQKDQMLNTLSTQNQAASNMSDSQKLDILNSLTGQK